MLNQMQKTVCALAVLAVTSLPALAASVDVKVIGTINPTACTPTLSGGGIVDYGTIKPSSLSATDYTVLEQKSVTFSITCDAPAKVAVRGINNRPGTVAAPTAEGTQHVVLSPMKLLGRGILVAGLGLDGTNKIGGYALQFNGNSFTTDQESVAMVYQLTDNVNTVGSWSAAPNGPLYGSIDQVTVYTWAKAGTTTPVAFTTLTGTLDVQAYINKTSDLNVAQPITLNGSSTIELIYL